MTEVTNPADVPVFEDYVDMLQVGARNMQNFVLLKAVGRSQLPVLLKRGLSATIEELLMAAEYILAAGNPNVVLCERGIRSFDTATRNTLDLAAVPVLRERTHLPVIVDPSHATGHRPLVRPMAVAGAAAGADGLIIEVHPDPPTRQVRLRAVALVPGVRRPDGRPAPVRVPAPAGRRDHHGRRPSCPATWSGCGAASTMSTRAWRRSWRSAPSSPSRSSRRATTATTATT